MQRWQLVIYHKISHSNFLQYPTNPFKVLLVKDLQFLTTITHCFTGCYSMTDLEMTEDPVWAVCPRVEPRTYGTVMRRWTRWTHERSEEGHRVTPEPTDSNWASQIGLINSTKESYEYLSNQIDLFLCHTHSRSTVRHSTPGGSAITLAVRRSSLKLHCRENTDEQRDSPTPDTI